METPSKGVKSVTTEGEPPSQIPTKAQYSTPIRHSATLKPASLNAKKAVQQKETNKSAGKAKKMEAQESVSSGRMTRSMTASQAGNAQPQDGISTGDANQDRSRPVETPKPGAKVRTKATTEVEAKAPKKEAATPKARTRVKRQPPLEKRASPASSPPKTAGPPLQPKSPPIVQRAEPILPSAKKPAPRHQRPKAAEFYETPKAPKTLEDHTGSAPPEPTTENIVKKKTAVPPPPPPPIPWDIYGLVDSSGDAKAKPKPVEATKKSEYSNLKTKPPKVIRNMSRQSVPGPSLTETSSGPSLPAMGTAAVMEEDLGEDQEADPHDKSMDADYIPLGPGPMPKIPKLPKAPKKRPKKQRPAPLSQNSPEPDVVVHHTLADTPYPFPPPPDKQSAVPSMLVPPPRPPPPLSPPPAVPPPTTLPAAPLSSAPLPPARLPPVVDDAPEADPAIWDLGTDTPPLHAVRRAPARPGNVYCETCFRDDLARWIRIRDGVVRVLNLLGGDSALQALRTLSWEAEEAELSSTQEYQASRVRGKGLGSPPPPEYVSSSSEDESEEEGPVVTAKKIIVMSDYGQSWEAPHFNEYPSDIVGLVLLRILAERPTSGLKHAEKSEMSALLESLREDVGIGPRFFDAMATVARNLVVRWRMKRLPKDKQPDNRSKTGDWWWEFDDALQTAHQKISVETHLPSLFVSTLATKAREASLGALAAKEAATAQNCAGSHDIDTPSQAVSLAELEKALGMAIPSNAFLKSIGDKLALAKHQLTPITKPTTTKQKRTLDPSAPTPSPKRRKSNNTTSPPLPTPLPNAANPTTPPSTCTSTNQPPPPIPLPCTYCSESTASHHHHTRRARHTRPPSVNPKQDDAADPLGRDTHVVAKPWTRPLAWAFPHLAASAAAARVHTALDWLRLVERERRVRVVEVLPAGLGLGPGHEGEGEGEVQVEVGGELLVGESEGDDGKEGGEAVVRFMVDSAGGRTRVVLVRMMGVFEVLLGLGGGGGGRGFGRSGSQVRFAPAPVMVRETTGVVMGAARSVGMWEDWRDGKLERSRFV